MILDILNKILNNSSLNEDLNAIKKNFQNIDDNTFKHIIELDPTYREGSNSAGKYGKWLLNLYNKGNLSEEDMSSVTSLLSRFEEVKEWFTNKDIQQFKTISDLSKALDEVELGELSSNQKDKRFKKEVKKLDLNANKVYEDSKWEVWVPNDYNASCKLSSNTQWCTGISSKGNYTWFDYYTKDREFKLYIVLNKKDLNDKYQFCPENGEFRDAKDESIKVYSFFNEPSNSGLKKFFVSLFPSLNSLSADMDQCEGNDLLNQLAYNDEAEFVYNIIEPLDDITEFKTNLDEFLEMLDNIHKSHNYGETFIKKLFTEPYDAAVDYKISPYDHVDDVGEYFALIKDRLLKEPKFIKFLKDNKLTMAKFEKKVNAEQITEDSVAEIVSNALEESYIQGWLNAYTNCLKEDIETAYRFENGYENDPNVDNAESSLIIPSSASYNEVELKASYPKTLLTKYLCKCFIRSENSDLYDGASDFCLDQNRNFNLHNFINYVACSLIDIRDAEEIYSDDECFDADKFVEQILANLKYIKL